ncbi:Oidioi.mRNA.OKI2018_I69.chr1.g3258.t1.cds [Oikopleura dioica]|uniref:Oidioi.mRNA.OKI2018_I69.chr1.g3258.t1.cds n=1 Tax=Oikopleura dioica TaxID=34765 RepID=A0ABN7STE9_OIKDI|nr:Oidioi.mRNA.OKI2018_I69.chr1.g3258.t1.cds [Oikopleura dioica]
MKIDNSGDQDVHMDTSILCGRTRHEAATMEQTIRDIMRTTTSEGIFDRDDDILIMYSDLMVMNEDTLNNMIRCSVCLEIYNETSRQRACITECCHQACIRCIMMQINGASSGDSNSTVKRELNCPVCRKVFRAKQVLKLF